VGCLSVSTFLSAPFLSFPRHMLCIYLHYPTTAGLRITFISCKLCLKSMKYQILMWQLNRLENYTISYKKRRRISSLCLCINTLIFSHVQCCKSREWIIKKKMYVYTIQSMVICSYSLLLKIIGLQIHGIKVLEKISMERCLTNFTQTLV
jgi:hypothetical protein